jgi:hypothetical protein
MTLSELLQKTLIELGQMTVRQATGGGNSTVTDSRLIDESEDAFDNGAIFVVRTTDGLAPEGQFKLVKATTPFDPVTGALTAESAFTAAPGAGDQFGVANGLFPLYTLIEIVNRALGSLGPIALRDDTTLDTAASTSEYSAAVAWMRGAPYAIMVQSGSDSLDPQWVPYHDWDWIPGTAPGTQGKIVFRQVPWDSAKNVRVLYRGKHPEVSAYGDAIAESVDEERIVQAVVEKALRWQNGLMQGSDDYYKERWGKAEEDVERAKRDFPQSQPPRRSHIFLPGDRGGRVDYPGDRNPR